MYIEKDVAASIDSKTIIQRFKNNSNNNDFKICPLSTQFKKLQLN